MPYEIEAFARRKEVQRDRDELDDLVEAARSRGPQECFQLGESELDRIEVRAIGRQEAQPRTDAFNRGLYLRLFVHREVIENDDVAGAERRDEHLLDVGEKRGIIDRPVEDGGRRQPLDAQRGHDRVRLPMAVGRVIAEPEPARTAAVAAQQIGRDAGFIDEDVAARIVQAQRVLPVPPARGDISATLFVGEYGFF
jgi:hypothetical protein